MRLTSQRVFIIHPKENPKVPLPERLQQLISDQKQTWREFADGYSALRAIKTRNMDCDGFSVTLQFNPRRFTSTSAQVDQQSLQSRKCFLCVENLPEEQRGILYEDNFLILCNPAPIFDRHFTISHVNHREQSIEAFPGVFLDLARELSPSYTVFYNGPKCGASAPDHMHFQACPANVLSIEALSADESKRVLKRKDEAVSVWTLRNCGRQAIVIESPDKRAAELALRRLLGAMRKTLATTDEPMVNVLCSFSAGTWRLIIFPRSKHRPEVYYREGNNQILISPAAVDLGGLIVTPLEKDFSSVDAQMVESIFREVSLDESTVERIFEAWE
jgi:ATP adenylyltransferase/5',5'''-P-1,P-4-tetraphosphate phosphorylase II